ncbi:MAG: exodeoxyribonuclease V subunit gamma, partial [Oscillospiraceae bacterium]|nr:exodeoxyribonuclease V subunit gamma [Oscillospiraceae bacterium]
WNRLTELLDILHDALGDTEMPPRTLCDLLTAVLRTNQIPLAPQMLDAVTVQNAAAARYDDDKIVFVLGVNEGAFPASIQQSGFFTESERVWLEMQGVSLSRSMRALCADERLIVYKTLSAPAEHLWLCYSLSGESGSKRTPSALLDEVRRILPHLHEENADSMGVSFYVSTAAAAYYSYVQDYAVSPDERETVRTLLTGLPGEQERLERLSAQQEPDRLRLTDPKQRKKLFGNTLTVSATQIERAKKCPFMGFCTDNLRLYMRKKQELNPLSSGNLVHLCMERLFRQYQTRDSFLTLTPADLRKHIDLCAADFLNTELGGAEDKDGRFLQNYDRLKSRIVGLLEHTQEEMRQSRFTPDACELVIGRRKEQTGISPYQLTLANGTQLILNGQIDRVDLCEQNGETYLRIVDYKTGHKEFSLADVYYGLNLQMLLYLFAISDDENAYPNIHPAGVLYMPAGAPEPGRPRDDAQPLADYIDAYFRMSGTVLLDRGILSSMEEQIAGVYIPAKLDSADPHTGKPVLTKDSSVFTPPQLANLREYVDQTVADYAEALLAGNVAPNPIRTNGADTCSTCGLQSLCGVDLRDRRSARKLPGESAAASAMRRIMENGLSAESEQEGDAQDGMDRTAASGD